MKILFVIHLFGKTREVWRSDEVHLLFMFGRSLFGGRMPRMCFFRDPFYCPWDWLLWNHLIYFSYYYIFSTLPIYLFWFLFEPTKQIMSKTLKIVLTSPHTFCWYVGNCHIDQQPIPVSKNEKHPISFEDQQWSWWCLWFYGLQG